MADTIETLARAALEPMGMTVERKFNATARWLEVSRGDVFVADILTNDVSWSVGALAAPALVAGPLTPGWEPRAVAALVEACRP